MITKREKFERLTIECSFRETKKALKKMHDGNWQIIHPALNLTEPNGYVYRIIGVRPL